MFFRERAGELERISGRAIAPLATRLPRAEQVLEARHLAELAHHDGILELARGRIAGARDATAPAAASAIRRAALSAALAVCRSCASPGTISPSSFRMNAIAT